MGIIKEFACAAHGPFEELVEGNEIPRCPSGCSPYFVSREFRTAPAYHQGKTKAIDGILNDVARDYNLPDIRADKDDGKSVMENLRSRDVQNTKTMWADTKNLNVNEFVHKVGFNKADIPAVKPHKLDGTFRGALPESSE